MQGYAGSSPALSLAKEDFYRFGSLAQSVEHAPFKGGVPGSIPGWPTKKLPFVREEWVVLGDTISQKQISIRMLATY